MFPSAGTQSFTLLTCQRVPDITRPRPSEIRHGSDVNTDQRPTDSLVAASQFCKVKKKEEFNSLETAQPDRAALLQLTSPASTAGGTPGAPHCSPAPDQRPTMLRGNVSTMHRCQHRWERSRSGFVREFVQLGTAPGEAAMGKKYPYTDPLALDLTIFTSTVQEKDQR